MEAVILVGGKGSRLQSVVNDRPKPMAAVAGRPFVEWLLLSLRAQGVQRIIFSTGYMSEMVETHFGNGRKWDIDVSYSLDPFPLGTAGAVRHALKQVESNHFLVVNGDSYCRANISRLEERHLSQGARASLWTVPVDDCRRYGSVDLDKNGAVHAFLEKPFEKQPGLINAGVYLLEREVVESIPEGKTYSLETDFFPSLIGHGLYAVLGEGPFLDIGIPETYSLAEEFLSQDMLL